MSDRKPRRPPFEKYAGNGGGRDDEQRHASSQTGKSQTKRRRQAAISLASFSSKKGHDRAIQEYKKRKDVKFQKNAVLLRGYQRAMKSQGYDVGKGASRKRDRREENVEGDPTKGVENSSSIQEGESQPKEQRQYKKRHKSDPLHHARKEAERRKAERLEMTAQKEQGQKKEVQKQHNRKARARKLMKRTNRGQPLMKNVIGDMLQKLKDEVGDKGESA